MKSFYNEEAKTLPVVKELLENFDEIKKEIFDFIETGKAYKYYDEYEYVDQITGESKKKLYEKDWKIFGIARMDWEGIDESIHAPIKDDLTNRIIKIVQRRCKKTGDILKKYENQKVLQNGFISSLTPGSKIHPHRGWNDKVLRVHLCFTDDPACVITVNGEKQSWKEKEILAFVDYDVHSVEHNGSKERVILIFDVPFECVEKYSPGFIEQRYASRKISV